MIRALTYLCVFVIFSLLAITSAALAAEMSSKRDCAICHVMWLDDFRTDKKPLIEWQPGNVLMKDTQGVVSSEEICYSCHDGYVNDSRSIAWKFNGHKTFVKPSSRVSIPSTLPLSNKGEIYCGTCHSAHGAGAAPDDSGITSFFREKNMNSSLCAMCHANEADFKRSNSHPLQTATFDLPDTLFKLGSKPGTNRNNVICQSCHKAHGARGNKITVVDNKNSKLCVTCHDGPKSIINTKHDLRKSFPNEKNIMQQRPVESGPCGVCHMPHNSANKRLWAKQLPPGKESRSRFCLSCHQKGKVAEAVTITGTSHPLNVNPFEKIQSLAVSRKKLTLPLFSLQGAPDKNGNITCATCHDPHGSKTGSTTARTAKNINSNTSTSFLRKRQKDMCGECHLDKNLVINSKHDMSKMAPETKNILNRTPSESGLCGSCHLVHKGQGAFLWAREIKPQNKNIIQGICTSCHNEKGMAGKKVIKDYSHPVNVSPLKKGLTTTLPLFDKNGKKSKKGEMTCLTCHEPHRWDPTKIIDSDHYDTEGNTRNSFLRLQASPGSKLCQNCHPNKANIEKTDHDLGVTDPESKNIKGQTPVESGVCGVCHLVHNSENWVRLWARNFGSGENLMDMMCNSCHSSKGTAKDKIPQISSHPQEKLINSAGRDVPGRIDFFPMFHKSYGEPETLGTVSCPSCHDAHKWDAGVNAKGMGANIEGDATNSFLRSRSSILPCKDCHGPEALYRYKYFHNANERKTNMRKK
ncbi:MAG: cytochrome c3 family protein [Desulfobacteraceae bacterium]|nr:cytochrome c3 family protein [Desulfobacteraceae bacterium]MDH3837396.1 cytochrome c3 family protein [Desulfobacteraceae bacterium]MDH3874722.1 cytochrome c3 family protein [Desulfobacteraceae bacterium]